MQGIIAHMASSSDGFFDGQQYHLDLVRLGTAMFGSLWNTTAARGLTRITGIKQVLHQFCLCNAPRCPAHPARAVKQAGGHRLTAVQLAGSSVDVMN